LTARTFVSRQTMLAVRSWYSQRKHLPDLSSYGNSIQFQRPFLNAQFALGRDNRTPGAVSTIAGRVSR